MVRRHTILLALAVAAAASVVASAAPAAPLTQAKCGSGQPCPPPTPTNLAAVPDTSNSVAFTWQQPRSTVSATSWLVRVDGNVVATVATTSYTATALACGSHTFGVSAQSSGGATSNTATISSTLPCSTDGPVPSTSFWRPPLHATWQWELTEPVDQSVDAQIYDIDSDYNDASVVASLHAKGRKVVCYIDAGSWESYRPDASLFPISVLGNAVSGWSDERWLDIRRLDILQPIMRQRLETCRSKGFDGVEFDWVDAYAQPSTGFAVTATDQLTYNQWLASEAHLRGLFVLLKNDLGQVDALLPYFDGALNEQCFEFAECAVLSKFVAAGKPVFNSEYNLSESVFCSQALALGFNSMVKHVGLDAWRQPCL